MPVARPSQARNCLKSSLGRHAPLHDRQLAPRQLGVRRQEFVLHLVAARWWACGDGAVMHVRTLCSQPARRLGQANPPSNALGQLFLP